MNKSELKEKDGLLGTGDKIPNHDLLLASRASEQTRVDLPA
jgi:hypothetical protein